MSKITIKCSKAQFDRIVKSMESYYDSDGKCILGKRHLNCPAALGYNDLTCKDCIRKHVIHDEEKRRNKNMEIYERYTAEELIEEAECVEEYGEWLHISLMIYSAKQLREHAEMLMEKTLQNVVSSVKKALVKYPSENIDVVLDGPHLNVIFHSDNNSFDVESRVAQVGNINLLELEKSLDQLHVGHCW